MKPTLSKLLKIVSWKGLGQTNEPQVDAKRKTGDDFVFFGKYNLFPELCQGLTYNVAPLHTCVHTHAALVAGEGVEFLTDEEKVDEKATAVWNNLTRGSLDILEEIAYHQALLGSRSWELIYTGRGKLDSIFPLDTVRVRSGRKNDDGVVGEFYFCDDWERYQRGRTGYDAEKIPSFDIPSAKKKAALYRRGRGNDYYGYPRWIAAMTDAEVWQRIPIFNRTQIDTGFRPAAHIHIPTNKDESELTGLKAEVEQFLTGADAQTFAVTHGPTADPAPTINKLERGDHAGELDKISDRAELVIYKAFGMPPILAGVEVSTGLSGKGLAIEQSLTLYERMRVNPDQNAICRDIREIMIAAGAEPKMIRIRKKRPFDSAVDQVLTRQTYLARTTVNADLIANGLQPFPPNDPRGEKLLIEVLRGDITANNVNTPANG